MLLDSQVTIGATSHGRSSSPALAPVQQTSLPYVRGGALYPAPLFAPSDRHRADAPSRCQPIAPPTIEPPLWLTDLEKGDPRRFDTIVFADRLPRRRTGARMGR